MIILLYEVLSWKLPHHYKPLRSAFRLIYSISFFWALSLLIKHLNWQYAAGAGLNWQGPLSVRSRQLSPARPCIKHVRLKLIYWTIIFMISSLLLQKYMTSHGQSNSCKKSLNLPFFKFNLSQILHRHSFWRWHWNTRHIIIHCYYFLLYPNFFHTSISILIFDTIKHLLVKFLFSE